MEPQFTVTNRNQAFKLTAREEFRACSFPKIYEDQKQGPRNQHEGVQMNYENDRTKHNIFTIFETVNALNSGNKLPIIQIEVNEIPTIALCDSGATCSLMKRSFFEKFKTKYPYAKLDKIGVERTTLR